MVSFIVYCPKIIKVAFIILSKFLLALKIADLNRALVSFSQWLSVCVRVGSTTASAIQPLDPQPCYSLMRKKTEKSMSWPFYNPLWSFFGQLH